MLSSGVQVWVAAFLRTTLHSFISCLFSTVHDSFDFGAEAVDDMLSTAVPHYYCVIQQRVIQHYTVNHRVASIVLNYRYSPISCTHWVGTYSTQVF